jgi:hypothetical protein
MKRALLLLSLTACSAPSAEAMVPEEPVAAVEDDDTRTLPAGAFASIDALCARQMADMAPVLEERSRDWMADEKMIDEPITPSCAEDAAALRTARVTLGGPFLALSAVTYETPDATLTSLVVRTRAGWMAVSPAVVEVARFDPGCGSIVRDDGVREVRLEDGWLVIVDSADRGWGESKDLLLERARACTLRGACSAPVTTAVTIADESGKTEVFRTTYTIGAQGEIVPAHEWEEPEFAE